MISYPKIETLYIRDDKFKVIEDKFRLEEFDYLKDNQWTWTEKVDGTSIKVLWDGQTIKFGGKTDEAQIPTLLLAKLHSLFTPQLFIDNNYPPLCLYGEGYGARIQKGGGNYISNNVDFALFDVLIGKWWLKRDGIEAIASRLCSIVPVVGKGTLKEATEFVKKGFNSRWGDFPAEGIVLKPEIDLFARNGQRIISKLKARDF